MTRLLNYFLKGIVLLAPLVLTIYVCVRLFDAIDGWMGIPIRGVGFLVTVLLITMFGFLASNILSRTIFGLVERVMNRLPFVRLLYSSTRDFLNAFVGEKRRFDKPVLVRLHAGATGQALGFVTQESLGKLGLAGHVAVYVPQSYGLAGSLLMFPVEFVTPVALDSAEAMAFIVSGGVTAL